MMRQLAAARVALSLLLAPIALADNPATIVGSTFATHVEYGADTVVTDPSRLTEIDNLILSALRQNQIPGCVVEIGTEAGIVYRSVYGRRQFIPVQRQ